MFNYKPSVRTFASIVFFLLILSYQMYSQDSTVPDKILTPGPTPFSLDAGSAIYCINLLKNNLIIEKKDESAKYRIVEIQTVWSWFLEYDKSYPEGHRKRYDIIVNGTPLNWDNSYIEYGSEMLNLRLLFLYRNQHPPKSLEYYSVN